MIGIQLIMWLGGQWEASKKTAPDGASTQTDRHTDMETQWGPFSEKRLKKVNSLKKGFGVPYFFSSYFFTPPYILLHHLLYLLWLGYCRVSWHSAITAALKKRDPPNNILDPLPLKQFFIPRSKKLNIYLKEIGIGQEIQCPPYAGFF